MNINKKDSLRNKIFCAFMIFVLVVSYMPNLSWTVYAGQTNSSSTSDQYDVGAEFPTSAGQTISGEYTVSKDITLTGSAGQSAVIVGYSGATINIPAGITLTLKGGAGKAATTTTAGTGGGAGIELLSGRTLTVQGEGDLVVAGGAGGSSYMGVAGGNGSLSTSFIGTITKMTSGAGGYGGYGGGGAGAAIGTTGTAGGTRGGSGGSASCKDTQEISGNNGSAGADGASSSAAGTLIIKGKVNISSTTGQPIAYSGRASAGSYKTDSILLGATTYAAGAGAGGGTGGSGGMGPSRTITTTTGEQKELSIGSGGAGGGGGGGGASGSCMVYDFGDYCIGNGGGGGAGGGYLVSQGGLANLTHDGYNQAPTHGGSTDETTGAPGAGGTGAKSPKADSDVGGNGGKGGAYGTPGASGMVYATTLPSSAALAGLKNGGNSAAICQVFPVSECEVTFLDEPNNPDGKTYTWEKSGVKPRVKIVHKPTNTTLSSDSYTVSYQLPEGGIGKAKAVITGIAPNTSIPSFGSDDMLGSGNYTLDYEIKYKGTITGEVVSSKEYDGKPYTPDLSKIKITLNDETGTIVENPIDKLKLEYYPENNKNALNGEAPINVGRYKLVLTSGDDYNFSGEKTDSFEIWEKYLQVNEVTTVERDYIPGNKSVDIDSVTFYPEDVELQKDVDFEVVKADMDDPNAGDAKNVNYAIKLLNHNYFFYEKGVPSYTVTGTTTAKINKIYIDYPTASPDEYFFDGTEQTYSTPGIDGLYSVSGNKATNAGEYSAVYHLEDPNNASWIGAGTDDYSIDWQIQKTNGVELEAENVYYQPAEAGQKTYKLRLPEAPIGFKQGMAFEADGKDDPQSIIDSWSIANDGTVTFTIASGKEAGNAADLNFVVETNNYEESTGSLHVELIAEKIGVTLEGVSVNDKEYDGKPIEPEGTLVVKDNNGNIVTVPSSQIDYLYYDEDGNVLPGAPSEIGNYYLVISLTPESKYYGETEKMHFSISGKGLSVQSATGVSRAYEEGNKEVEIDTVTFNDGVILQKGIDYTVTKGTMSDDKAGTNKEASFLIELINDHYTFDDGSKKRIEKALVDITPAEAEVPIVSDITFDGEEHAPIIQTDDYSISGQVKGTDVSEYTTTLILKDKTNKVWETGDTEDKNVKWNIKKATYSFEDESIPYAVAESGDKTYSFKATLPVGMNVGLKYSLFDYEDSDDILAGIPTVDESTGKISYSLLADKQEGDKASIEVKVESANYQTTNIKLNINIVGKKAATFVGGSVESKEHYDGTEVVPSISNLKITSGGQDVTSEIIDGGYLEYKYYKSADGDVTPYSEGTPKNAGEYQLVLGVKDSCPIYSGHGEAISFSIGTQPISIVSNTAKVVKQFDGTTSVGALEGELKYSGVIDADKSSVSVGFDLLGYTNPNVQTDVSTSVNLVINGDPNGNYTLEQSKVNIPYTITPRIISISNVEIESRQFVEGDTSANVKSVVFGNTVDAETVDYTVMSATAKSSYVGTQDVDYRIKINNGNYAFSTGDTAEGVTSIAISKADSVDFGIQKIENYTNKETGERSYSIETGDFPEGMTHGIAITPSSKIDDKNIIGDWNIEDGEITYDLQGGEVGDEATLIAKIDSDNYLTSYVSVKVSLVERERATITGAKADSKTYDQQPNLVNTTNLMITDSKGRDITSAIVDAGQVEIYYYKAGQTETPFKEAPKTAGHYGWEVTISDANDKYVGSQFGEFIISPQEVTADASKFKYSKSYDTTKEVKGSEGAITLSGVYEGDNVEVVVNDPGYENASVQNGTLSKGISLNGSDAASYVLSSENIEITHEIIPAKIKLNSAEAVSRGFIPGDRTVEIGSVVFDNLPGEETPEYSAMGIMADDSIGTGKTVTYAVMLNDGNYLFQDGSTYASGQTTVDITPGESAEYDSEVETYTRNVVGSYSHQLQFINPPAGIHVTSTELASVTPIKGITNISYDPTTSIISYDLTGTADQDTVQSITVNVFSDNYNTCTITLKILFTEKPRVTITNITADGKVYDGKAVNLPDTSRAQAVDESGEPVIIDPSDYQFAYYINTVTEENELSEPPKDAGTYFVVPWIDNADYVGRCEPIQFEITKADVAVNAGTFHSSKVYDGTQTPNFTGELEISGVLDADKGKISATPSTVNFGPNVGKEDKEVLISLNGEKAFNYNLTTDFVSVPFEITPKEISISGASAQNRVYEFLRWDVTISSVNFNGAVDGESVAYNVSSGIMDTDTAGTNKDVSFTVTLPESSNYCFAGGELSEDGKTTVDIAKQNGIDYGTLGTYLVCDYTGSISLPFILAYPGGMSTDMKYSVTGVDDPKTIMSNPQVKYNLGRPELSFTANGGEAGDEAVVTIKITSANYTDSVFKYRVTLIDTKEVTIKGFYFDSHTYDKNVSPVKGTAIVEYNGEDITDEIDPNDIKFAYYKNGQVLKKTPVDVGDYQMVAILDDSKKTYRGQSAMIPFSITKAPLEVEAGSVKVSKTYDGTLKPAMSGDLKVSGIISGDETLVNVAPNLAEYSTKDVQNVMKTLSLTVNGEAAGNYALKTSTIEVPYNITPKTIAVGSVTAQDRAYENGNDEVKIDDVVFDGVVSGEKPGYSIERGAGFMKDDKAGAKKQVTGAVIIEDKNYEFNGSVRIADFDTTVNIAKASAVTLASEKQEICFTRLGTYTHKFELSDMPKGMEEGLSFGKKNDLVDPYKFISSYNINEKTGELTFVVGGAPEPSQNAGIPVGIFSDNFEDSKVDLEIEITDKIDVTISGMWIDNKTYDGKVAPLEGQFEAYAGAEDVTDQFKPEDISHKYYKIVGEDRQELTQAPTNAGKYELEVHAETDIYRGTVTYPYEITQREITIEGQTINAKVGDKAPDLNTYDKVKIYKVTGLVDGEPLVKEPVATYEKTPDMSKAGEYAIKLNGTEVTENYVVAKVTDGKLVVSSGEGPNPDGPGGGINTGDDAMVILFAGLGIIAGATAILLRRRAK